MILNKCNTIYLIALLMQFVKAMLSLVICYWSNPWFGVALSGSEQSCYYIFHFCTWQTKCKLSFSSQSFNYSSTNIYLNLYLLLHLQPFPLSIHSQLFLPATIHLLVNTWHPILQHTTTTPSHSKVPTGNFGQSLSTNWITPMEPGIYCHLAYQPYHPQVFSCQGGSDLCSLCQNSCS